MYTLATFVSTNYIELRKNKNTILNYILYDYVALSQFEVFR